MEKELTSVLMQVTKSIKVNQVEDLNHALLMKLSKDSMANLIENMAKCLNCNLDVCKSAAGLIDNLDNLKSEKIKKQENVIELQQQQLEKVQDTIKTEISTWSDVAKKNCQPDAPSLRQVEKAVESAASKSSRSCNFIVYGAEEEDTSLNCVLNTVTELCNVIEVWPRPQLLAASRIGTFVNGKVRPIKVTVASPEIVNQVLSSASRLKSSEDLRSVYLAPDRSKDERLTHQKLVKALKEKIANEPYKYHYIRDGKIVTVDKT